MRLKFCTATPLAPRIKLSSAANTTTRVLTPQSTFGQILGTTDPRIAQLAIKLAF